MLARLPTDFEEMSWWFEWERLLASINALTVFLSTSLLRVSDRLSMLIRVVQTASQTLLAWFIIAGSFFLGYAFMGYILFGATLRGFSTVGRSFMTLFNYIIGQFDNAKSKIGINYAQSAFYSQAERGGDEVWHGAGFASLKYVGMQLRMFLADPSFYFFTFNLIFYLFLMRIMVAMLVTAYTDVSTRIERKPNPSQGIV